MALETGTSGHRGFASRLAMRMLPPHRKEWGEAMLNEAAYIEQREAASQWVLGCVVTALRERVVFELGRTFMTRRVLKVLLGIGAVLLMGAVGTYVDLKPYQRDRIWMEVHEAIHPVEPERISRSHDAPASKTP